MSATIIAVHTTLIASTTIGLFGSSTKITMDSMQNIADKLRKNNFWQRFIILMVG